MGCQPYLARTRGSFLDVSLPLIFLLRQLLPKKNLALRITGRYYVAIGPIPLLSPLFLYWWGSNHSLLLLSLDVSVSWKRLRLYCICILFAPIFTFGFFELETTCIAKCLKPVFHHSCCCLLLKVASLLLLSLQNAAAPLSVLKRWKDFFPQRSSDALKPSLAFEPKCVA